MKKQQKQSFFFTILACTMIMCTLVANAVAGKNITLPLPAPFTYLPGGFIVFPFIYALSDIISEVWGFRRSRWLAWGSLGLNLIAVAIYNLIMIIPAAPWSMEVDAAMKVVFGTTFFVLLGGIVGMILGGWMNDIVFQAFRSKDGIAKFSKRKVLSSAAGEAVDTICFIVVGLGFSGITPWASVPTLIFAQYIGKLVVEYAALPLTAWCVKKAREYEGENVFEDVGNFNIFGFEKNKKSNINDKK